MVQENLAFHGTGYISSVVSLLQRIDKCNLFPKSVCLAKLSFSVSVSPLPPLGTELNIENGMWHNRILRGGEEGKQLSSKKVYVFLGQLLIMYTKEEKFGFS